jgi:glycosyltransferase involved in cell wall biosynthesis
MFSIVIPLYNKAKNIEKTLTSLLNQSFTEFEIVIVNDGSTDDGVEVINRFTNDSRINLVHQENKGASAARNKGVRVAKYNYVAFIDGDDEWTPNYLSEIKKAIELFPDTAMFCTAGLIRYDNKKEVPRSKEKYLNRIVEIDFFKNPYFYTNTSSTVVKKNIFITTGMFPENLKSNEDIACFYSFAFLTPVIYCGNPMSIYNRGIDGHLSSIDHFKMPVNVVTRFNYVHKHWIECGTKRKNSYLGFMKYEVRNNINLLLKQNKFEAVNYYAESLSQDVLKHFNFFEFFLYKRKKMKLLSFCFIIATKISWKIKTFNY